MAFLYLMSPFSPQRKTHSCISLNQCILLARMAEGYDWHHSSHITISNSLGIYSDEHSLQPLSPTPLMLTGTIKTLPVFSLGHLLKNALHAWLRAWKLPAGHPVQPPRSRTHYSSLLWPSNHDSDSSKKIPHKTSINTKCTLKWITRTHRAERAPECAKGEVLPKTLPNLRQVEGKWQRTGS